MSCMMIGRFLALAVSLVLAMPGTAAVQEKEKFGVLRNKETGFVLDSNAAKKVYASDANGGDFQQWQFIRSDDGSYVLRNKATGFVLDSNAAKNVYTSDANGGAFQQWRD